MILSDLEWLSKIFDDTKHRRRAASLRQQSYLVSLLLQSRKFRWYLLLSSSMLLYDVIMRSYWCHSIIHCLLFTVSVNLVYVKLWVLATKIKFWSKTCMIQKGTGGTAPKKLMKLWKIFLNKVGEQKWTVMHSVVSTRDKSIVWMYWNDSSSMSGAVLTVDLLTSGDWRGGL